MSCFSVKVFAEINSCIKGVLQTNLSTVTRFFVLEISLSIPWSEEEKTAAAEKRLSGKEWRVLVGQVMTLM